MAQTKILVTGGMGFIGSNLIRRLMKNHPDWFIINFDKLTYAGNPKNLSDLEKNPHYIFIKGDVADKVDIQSAVAIEGPDIVVHMAAESHVDRSISGGDEFIDTNITGTYNVLEACRIAGTKKILYVSTDEVYGSQDHGEFVDEKAIMNPSSVYSAAKASGDLLCNAYFKTYKLPVVISRSSNNFGPYQFPEKFIPLAMTNLLENKRIPVYGEGENVRDWLFVEDNCSALEMLIELGTPGEIYNINSKNEYSNMEMVEMMLEVAGYKDQSMIEFVKDRPGHDFRYAMNNKKMLELGWKPDWTWRNFKMALIFTYKWYQEHTDWWKELKLKVANKE
jgi:dTDP-glucose 4,6-dehydratase